jgi:uncharacterized protein RhaS with RHS repeats
MKSTRHVILMFFCALLFPVIGQCFYNPSTGKWLSRDPIEEQGGANLYQFVFNAPIAAVDFVGLAIKTRNKNNTQTITLGNCEVTIVIGHGSQNNPHVFKGPPNACWAGGFLGCYAETTNGKLGVNRVPGAPNWEDDITNKDDEYKQAWKDIVQGAEDAANKICKDSNCKCTSVKISYFYAPNYSVDDIARPSLPSDKVVPCAKTTSATSK